MAFSSTPPALQIDSEAARRLLEPMLPRRLRACLAQDLRVASARSELALEINTLAPDAEALVSAWIAAATSAVAWVMGSVYASPLDRCQVAPSSVDRAYIRS